MKQHGKRMVSMAMALVLMITCATAGLVLPATALIPEYGEVEIFVPEKRPNLLIGQDDAATDKIWADVPVYDPHAATMEIGAGLTDIYWNLSFLNVNTTYQLTGRVKGGTPKLYFFDRFVHVNSGSYGTQPLTVSETDWTSFSFTFTTGNTRPANEMNWFGFNNEFGTATAYFDSLYLTEVTLTDLAVSDFVWNDTESPRTAKPGDVLTDFTVTVTNKGEQDIAYGELFAVDICVDATVNIETLTYYKGLAAGASITLHSSRSWKATEGDHSLTAFAYTDTYTYERSQTTEDNYLFFNLRVADTELEVPTAAAERGFTELTFSDDFNSVATIDTDATGKAGYKWYVTRPWGESDQILDVDYSVADGVLTLHSEQTKWAYSLSTIDAKKMVGYAFNQGYLEYRIRVPRNGDENWNNAEQWADDANNTVTRNPGVWGYPTTSIWASLTGNQNQQSVELDWMEYYGKERNKHTYNFSTTLHVRESGLTDQIDPDTNEVELDENGDPIQKWDTVFHTTVGEPYYGDIGSETEFHTLSCAWSDGVLETYLDGVKLHTIAYTENDYPSDRDSDMADDPKVGSASYLDQQFMQIVLGGSEQFQMEVDYVRVWQAPESSRPTETTFTPERSTVTMAPTEKTYVCSLDANGDPVHHLTYTSENTDVVSAYNDGLLYAVGEGTAVVRVQDIYGNTELFTVNVDRYANRLQNSDFEGWADSSHWWQILYGTVYQSSVGTVETVTPNATLVTEQNNTYMHFFKQDTAYKRYYRYAQLEAGKTYRWSGRYKGAVELSVTDQNSYIVGGSKKVSLSAEGWTEFTFDFTVTDEVSNTGNLQSKTLGFINVAGKEGYLDDLCLAEVAPVSQVIVDDTITGGTLQVSKTTELVRGETVSVTVIPQEGYMLETGSLTYTTESGETRAIFNNKDSQPDDVSGGVGNTFTFAAPAGMATVSAKFVSTSQNNYQYGTLATAVHRTDGKVDGVRFLNRLYIDDLDVSGNDLQVIHNGQTRTITQIGVLMTRGEQESLTLQDYNDYANGTSSQRVWHALSYEAPSSVLVVVEYTHEYLDFAISMSANDPNSTAFLQREYTICGYFELDNGDVIYTKAMHDSVIGALTREGEIL